MSIIHLLFTNLLFPILGGEYFEELKQSLFMALNNLLNIIPRSKRLETLPLLRFQFLQILALLRNHLLHLSFLCFHPLLLCFLIFSFGHKLFISLLSLSLKFLLKLFLLLLNKSFSGQRLLSLNLLLLSLSQSLLLLFVILFLLLQLFKFFLLLSLLLTSQLLLFLPLSLLSRL